MSNTTRLEVHAKPRATIVLFETQLPLAADAPTIYRYTTRGKVVFELHIQPNGVETWYKEIRPSNQTKT